MQQENTIEVSRPLPEGNGGMILVFGILSFLFCAPIFGPLAWIMGASELRAIRNRKINENGRGITLAGTTLGIISSVLILAGLVIWFSLFLIAAAATNLRIQRQQEVQEQLARSEEFQVHLERGEQALANGNFKEAEIALSKAIRLFPDNVRAKANMASLKTRLETKRQLDAALQEAAQALAAKDLPQARQKLAAATNIQAADVRVIAMGKQLRDAEDEAVFAKNVEDGDRALGKAELPKALGHFQNAKSIRPDRAKPQETIAAIQALQSARTSLNAAMASLDQKQIPQAHGQAKTTRDIVLGESRKKFDDDKRYAVALNKLTEDAAPILWQIAKELHQLGETRKGKAQAATKKNEHSVAVAEYDGARQALTQAKDFVQAITSFAAKETVDEIKKRAMVLGVEIAVLSSLKEKATVLDLRQKGDDLLKEGSVQLTLAKKDSSHLRKAASAFANAQKSFDAARQFKDTDAETGFEKAQDACAQVAKLIRPFHLDFTEQKELTRWTFAKNEWVLHFSNEQNWMQGVNVATAPVLSPIVEFPVDFDLALRFAMVDANGNSQNDSWKHFPEFLTLTITPKGKDSAPLSIVLGNDPTSKLQDIAHIAVGAKRFAFAGDKKAGWISLGLVRRQGTATLTVQEKEISTFAVAGDFQQLALRVKNARAGGLQPNTFLAIYAVSLKMHGDK